MKATLYVVIFLSFCTHLIQCSCLSYGHSCWGGHGKRSSSSSSAEIRSQPKPDRWALFRTVFNDNDDSIYGRERSLLGPRDDSLDFVDRKTPNDLLADQELPMYVDDLLLRENRRPSLGLKYLLRKRKLIATDLMPTPDPDTAYETTPSNDVYVPRNNRFYKFLVD